MVVKIKYHLCTEQHIIKPTPPPDYWPCTYVRSYLRQNTFRYLVPPIYVQGSNYDTTNFATHLSEVDKNCILLNYKCYCKIECFLS